MRRLDIASVRDVAQEYGKYVLKGCSKVPKKVNAQTDELRNLIKSIPQTAQYQAFRDYIQFVWDNYEKILILEPDKFQTFADSFVDTNGNKINVNVNDVNWKKWQVGETKIEFYKAIVEAMNYEHVRESKNGYLKYFEMLNIKTCAYCNASYIMNVRTKKRDKKGFQIGEELKGRFELDHFFPKSKYPFLCISFFNLIPCCPCCNRWKSDDESTFSLYTSQKQDLDVFTFYLTNFSIIEYVLKHDVNKLNIKLKAKDINLKYNHEARFHIEELYEHFKDEAEEILWIFLSQNNAYFKQAMESFNKVFDSKALLRIMYGVYEGDENIHKRPLSKMKMDILHQLKLIK